MDQGILRQAALMSVRPARSELFLALAAHCQRHACDDGSLLELFLDLHVLICLMSKEIVPDPVALLLAAVALVACRPKGPMVKVHGA